MWVFASLSFFFLLIDLGFVNVFFHLTDLGFVIVFFLLINLGFVVLWFGRGRDCAAFFFFFVWWILVATMKVDAGIAVAEVAVTVAIGFCGDCFYIILKYYIYYFKWSDKIKNKTFDVWWIVKWSVKINKIDFWDVKC